MQYGVDVSTYKRVSRGDKEKREIKLLGSPFRLAFDFIGAFLLSRVVINIGINTLENLAPFGIAFLLAFLNRGDRKESIVATVGALLGYVTLMSNFQNIQLCILIVTLIAIFQNISLTLKSRNNVIVGFSIIILSMIFYRAFVNHFPIDVNIITSLVQTIIIYPIYYIIKYAITCIDDINTNHLFNTEEMVSMALLICLVVSGIGDVQVFNVGIRNIAALFFIITIAFGLGSSVGAAAGVTMGIIVGLATNNMMLYISVYGVCGLMVGIFKDTGKFIAMIAYLIIYLILAMYSKTFDGFQIIEAVVSGILFSMIPKMVYFKLAMELDNDKKQDAISELHFIKIKEEFTSRLNDFTEVLSTMSLTLNNLMDNDRLLLKNKSSALIENLADRVCGSCDMKYLCWKRELHSTYNAFAELIRNYQDGGSKFPQELEKKCIKKFGLIKNTEEIVNNYILNETLRKRLSEGRKLLAGHISNMAVTIGEIIDDFNRDITICSDVERTIRRALNKLNIKYDDVLCYNDKQGRLNIKIMMDNCHGGQLCIKELLPIINSSIGRTMSVGGDGCSIDPTNNKCTVRIEEAPKYHISSYAAVACKEGEKFTGDSYSFGKTKDGNYMIVISDGMGSGPEAGVESKAAVELIEKFTQSGFSELTAINTVNSIMTMKFSEDEKFATLDMQNIDLYSGNITFMKIGAVESFIKRGDKIEVVKSNTLPFGVLDSPDVDIVEKKVSNGDVLVTISDGVLEGIGGESNCEWLVDFLGETKNKNPKELVNDILEKAKELNGGKTKDDMTVVVSKIYALY
ncbi:stage II sporulation protein E [Clostridium polyendosporum]|uniref:Stage II sporulation protein E n=1 Tax=Clostridium polyendosporum TaxID=69208 RepID=A0A919VFD5_9CLOT|nr:stage II sporulation protein E [Clostridium polyendosporum]GIM30179.1 stage II sporulation protein E [Clostridium polyendosporum]